MNALAASSSLQGDVLMAILDKSLPTASGLAGESVIRFTTSPDKLAHAMLITLNVIPSQVPESKAKGPLPNRRGFLCFYLL